MTEPRRWRVLQQDEWKGYKVGRDTAPYPPMVFQINPFHWVTMDAALQRFWYGLNVSPTYGYNNWLNTTADNKALTNNHGIETNRGVLHARDYIGGRGLKLRYPCIGTYISGREVIIGTEVKLTTKQNNLPRGTWCIALNTIKAGRYEGITRETHPELIHVGKIFMEGRKAENGLTQVNAFPEGGGREGSPVYFPIVSKVQMYYPREKVVLMRDDEPAPSMYNPP